MNDSYSIFLCLGLIFLSAKGREVTLSYVTPSSVESSSLRGGGNINNIIDGNDETSACTKMDSNPWFQTKFDGMHCIAQIRLKRLHERDCTITVLRNATIGYAGPSCEHLHLHILNGSAESTTSSSRSGCLIGDTVKIGFIHSSPSSLCVSEIRIVQLLIGCEVDSLTWENVTTDPLLPVKHEVQLKLNCEPGKTNSGGDVAECKDGKLELIGTEPPNCGFDCKANSLKWENVTTNPQLPVEHGTQLRLSCPTDQIKSGGDVAECKDGKLELIGIEPLNCEFDEVITPTSVRQSSSADGDYGADKAIDGNNNTQSWTDFEAAAWWEAQLSEVYCISQVIVIRVGSECTYTFSCGIILGHGSAEDRCDDLSVEIYGGKRLKKNEDALMPQCVLGDTVKLQIRTGNNNDMQLSLKEITIARRIDTEEDTKCCGKAPDWSNIEEMNQLPVKHESQLSVSCKHGYRNVGGNSNIRCQNGTIIAGEAPICLASCKNESIIWDHVQVYPRLPAKHGAQITFSCVSGYNNFGGGTANCNDGQLDSIDGDPQCFASCKDESIIWDHVQVDPWLPAEHGAQITFSCVSGYNNFGGGTANCNDGQLVPIHGNPECFADCRINSLSTEVKLKPKLPVSHKTLLELSCFPGHTNLGGTSAKCMDGNIELTSDSPLCMADCDRDSLPPNSRTNHSMPVQHGTELSVSCNEGYSNSGGSGAFCENGRINQGNPLNCLRDCSTKSIVWENVTVDLRLSIEHGTLITFTCVSGTRNFGGETARCQNGTFISTDGPPQCYVPGDCLPDSVLWNNTKTKPTLPVKHGERVTIKCADGYRNNGSVTATCVNGDLEPSEKPTSCLPSEFLVK